MPRLILMRHAKSSWSKPNLDDFERPLNARGRASAEAMGNWLRDQGHVPDEVLSSSSERAGETFLRLGINVQATFLRDLYLASAETMLSRLRGASGNVVMMIGHNPGIAEFAERLVLEAPKHPRFQDFPTCATLVADLTSSWPEADWGAAKVVDFAIPREVISDQENG